MNETTAAPATPAPTPVHKIEIVAYSDGQVQAATTADVTDTMQIIGVTLAKLALTFKEKAAPSLLPALPAKLGG